MLEIEHKDRLDEKAKQEMKKIKEEINDIHRLRKQEANNSIYKIRAYHTTSIVQKTEDIQKSFEEYDKKLYAQLSVTRCRLIYFSIL